MSKSLFSAVLSSFTLPVKSIDHARTTFDQARATLDSVSALFTAAGLNLEQMLAAGPDALKAHLDSIDNTEELAEALQDNERLAAESAAWSAKSDSLRAVATSLGIDLDQSPDAEAIATAFHGHVEKAVTLRLAQHGTPPIPNAPAAAPTRTDADLAAEYAALPAGPARLAFFSKHESALRRAAAR